jgi:S-DNA-T family DNA segregation ATPase FtsK/SpoIIIE
MPPYIKNTLLNFFSFFLIAFSLYIFVSLISYDVSDSGFFNKNSSDSIKI